MGISVFTDIVCPGSHLMLLWWVLKYFIGEWNSHYIPPGEHFIYV